MDNIKGDEIRHGKMIYLDALSKDRLASIPDEPLSESMLNRLHEHDVALQPITSREVVEKVKAQGGLIFAICLRADKSCIGVCSLMDVDWKSRRAQLKIAIVDGAHYTIDRLCDVIQTVLQFTYWEANLNRIYVYCPSDNGVLYEALDFCQLTNEGRLRQQIYRNGTYFDLWIYSILQREWSGRQDALE